MSGQINLPTWSVPLAVAFVTLAMGAGASGYAINTSAQVLQYPF